MVKRKRKYTPKGETGTLEHHVKRGNLSYEDAYRISLMLNIPFTLTKTTHTKHTSRPVPKGWSVIERRKSNA